MKCNKCNTENPSDALFCFECGTKLEEITESVFCTNCGAENSVKNKFCHACGTLIHNPVIEGNVIDGHEFIDLGLPSGNLWATCNVGADKPSDIGEYFAWGEIESKYDYDIDTYKYGKWKSIPNTGLKKLLNLKEKGTRVGYVIDMKSAKHDVAKAKWGANWQIPTENDFKELIDNCKWQKDTSFGETEVMAAIGPNGSKIFFPSTGIKTGTSPILHDSGNYWTSDFKKGYLNNMFALTLYFNLEGQVYISDQIRDDGLPVRPVYKK